MVNKGHKWQLLNSWFMQMKLRRKNNDVGTVGITKLKWSNFGIDPFEQFCKQIVKINPLINCFTLKKNGTSTRADRAADSPCEDQAPARRISVKQ